MRKNKGISLIVLIITIIVIIILATAILVSVISNNPISEANKARYESDRDNMQAVFTNTVGKIMSENQGVVNVTAGQINTETTGVNETTGTVAYTVDNATIAANASGTIIFDKGENTDTVYYIGRQLPIYAAGETKWYVDEDGVLSLEVAGVKYGSGEIVSASAEEETLAPGLYAENGTIIYTWQELLDKELFFVDDGVLYADLCGCSGYGGDSKTYNGARYYDDNLSNGNLIVSEEVTSIGAYGLCCYDCCVCLSCGSITLPKTLASISVNAFGDGLFATTYYNGTTEEWNNISLEDGWKYYLTEITVHCTDGDIIIPAN